MAERKSVHLALDALPFLDVWMLTALHGTDLDRSLLHDFCLFFLMSLDIWICASRVSGQGCSWELLQPEFCSCENEALMPWWIRDSCCYILGSRGNKIHDVVSRFFDPKFDALKCWILNITKCILFLCSSILSHGQIALLKLKKSQSLQNPVTPIATSWCHILIFFVPQSPREQMGTCMSWKLRFFLERFNMKHQTLQP